MKTYKIIFTSRGTITKLPNAQAIFGTICNVISQTKGDEEINKFLSSFKSTPMIINSSMFYNHIFPMIKNNVVSLDYVNKKVLNEAKENQLAFLNFFKEYKKIKFVSEKVFFNYIYSNKVNVLSEKLLANEKEIMVNKNVLQYKQEELEIKQKTELTTRVKTDKLDIENGKDRNLFYELLLYNDPKLEYVIYVKSDMNIEYLKSIFSLFNYFPIGNRKSVGKNIFEFKKIEEYFYESKDNDYKILLSNCIPKDNEFDYDSSYYQILSTISRTTNVYAKNELLGKILYLSDGSFMKIKSNKEYYGRLIPINISNKDIYIYGLGFVL